jgi:hypothetical protein
MAFGQDSRRPGRSFRGCGPHRRRPAEKPFSCCTATRSPTTSPEGGLPGPTGSTRPAGGGSSAAADGSSVAAGGSSVAAGGSPAVAGGARRPPRRPCGGGNPPETPTRPRIPDGSARPPRSSAARPSPLAGPDQDAPAPTPPPMHQPILPRLPSPQAKQCPTPPCTKQACVASGGSIRTANHHASLRGQRWLDSGRRSPRSGPARMAWTTAAPDRHTSPRGWACPPRAHTQRQRAIYPSP